MVHILNKIYFCFNQDPGSRQTVHSNEMTGENLREIIFRKAWAEVRE